MPKKLRVWANPWHAVDHEGRPCGVATVDPATLPPGEVRYVGATLKTDVIEKRDAGDPRPDLKDVSFEFDSEVHELPDHYSGFHRKLVRDGALLPADAETAKLCGVKFAPRDEALSLAKDVAAKEWFTNYGVDAPFASDEASK